MTYCILPAPGEVPGGIKLCGYEKDHPPPCKAEKICKSCGCGMNPDKVLDECRACNPELHIEFARLLQYGTSLSAS